MIGYLSCIFHFNSHSFFLLLELLLLILLCFSPSRYSGYVGDTLPFTTVFAERTWLDRKLPATAALQLIALANKQVAMVPAIPEPKPLPLFQTLQFTEHIPLSTEGYAQLKKDIQRYANYIQKLEFHNFMFFWDGSLVGLISEKEEWQKLIVLWCMMVGIILNSTRKIRSNSD